MAAKEESKWEMNFEVELQISMVVHGLDLQCGKGVFNYHEVPENMKVKLVAVKLRGRAP